MIQINLLPEELRPKDERFSVFVLMFLYALPVIFALIISIHLYLGGLSMYKSWEYKLVSIKWEKLGPERQKVDVWRRKYRVGSQKAEEINKLIAQRITFSDKMQSLVKALPNGIWFNHLTLKGKDFSIDGSVVSLKEEQMSLLNRFLNNLKEDKNFFSDFVSLELGRMSMRTLSGFMIMDFVLEGRLR